MTKKYAVPQESKGDVGLPLVKAGLTAVPILGAPVAELLQLLVQPLLDKRRNEWMEQVGEGLRKLEQTGLKLEELRGNEEFVSIVMHATQSAIRTHQDKKRRALRNAVLNVASKHAPDEARQLIFLGLIDTLTTLHLSILRFFQAPTVRDGIMTGSLLHVLYGGFPDLVGQRDFCAVLWRDLYSRGLLNTDSLNVTMTGVGLAEKRTTGLGDELIAFISEPDEAR